MKLQPCFYLRCAMSALALGGVAMTATAQEETKVADPAAAATAAVNTFVVEARARWKAACWDRADAQTRKAGNYIAVLAFDSAGKLVISGTSEVRESSDPKIAQCLRLQVNTFTIPAAGYPMSFEVPFAMP